MRKKIAALSVGVMSLVFAIMMVKDFSGRFSKIDIERVKGYTVAIYSPEGMGTGVVIDGDGDIITCEHVIEGNKVVIVKYHGKKELGTVIAISGRSDLAIVHIDVKTTDYAIIVGSWRVNAGDEIVSIGYPLGAEKFVSKGVLMGSADDRDKVKIIYTDTLILPGNSGGGLYDSHGNLVGLSTFNMLYPTVIQVPSGMSGGTGSEEILRFLKERV
jgi:S1-C subfamily serine protease